MHEIEPTPRTITWYRCALPPGEFKKLHEKSDLRGGLQTFGYLGLLGLTFSSALYSFYHWPIGVTLILTFLHGTVAAFYINAVHELGHNTVFKTKALNAFFEKFFSFFGWINYEMFDVSHTRHHRYTLHQPDDLEVVLPMKVIVRRMLVHGLFWVPGIWAHPRNVWRIATNGFKGEWELRLFPEGSLERKRAVRWARTMLTGHAILVGTALYFHIWILPFLTTFCAGVHGNLLQSFCNNTQHIGLKDSVADFRLCCRTFTLNPFIQFLYWHMNYHIEHHMFAAVPCYRLGKLHRLIKHDLPHCPHGIVNTWTEIRAILKIQEKDPTYQHVQILPQALREEAVVA